MREPWSTLSVQALQVDWVGLENLVVEQQCFSDWCWAAAAVSVGRHYGGTESQCRCVERVKRLPTGTCCGPWCSGGPHPQAECNVRALNADVSEALGANSAQLPRNAPIDFDEIEGELAQDRPVVIGLGGRGHLVVAFAVVKEPGFDAVVYRDPLWPQWTDPRVVLGRARLERQASVVFFTGGSKDVESGDLPP